MAVVVALILLLQGIKYAGKGNYFVDNFPVSQTRALKGIFAIYVIFHHLCTYVADYFPSFYAFKSIGFLMVGGFFLVSGYGLMYGQKYKQEYLKSFFKRRLLVILVPYYIIDIFYLIIQKYYGVLTLKYIILSIVGFNLWYIMAIMILYLCFYIAFKFFSHKKGLMLINLFTFAYIAVMFILYKKFNYINLGYWWYNSVICFLIGIWYCEYKNKIDIIFKKYYLSLILISFAIIIPTYYYTSKHYNEAITILLPIEILCAFAFSILILLLTLKFQFANKIINFCGNLSLELYLSHAIFISAWRSNISIFGFKIYISNNLLYLLLILISTVIFSYCVSKISKLLLKIVSAKKDHQQAMSLNK